MWRFMVRLMTDIDFADGDEASDEAVRNYLESSSPTPFRSRRESRAPKEQRRRVESVSVTRTELAPSSRRAPTADARPMSASICCATP
jgi:hypothetical protein